MAIGSILLAILGIGLLIFLHEGGHFLAARLAGVRVEVFSLGFGPRIWGFYWRGTDFRLSAVPFGGYVMVAGQDPSDRRYPASESLHSKRIGQRALFWSGGVVMNVLFALIVFPIVFGVGVKFPAPVISTVVRGTAAWEAGIESGDRVIEVAGKEIYSMQNLMIEVALHGNRPLDLLVEDPHGTRRVVTALPQFDGESGLYGLGVSTPPWDPESFVLEVTPNGPAAAAGLASGDRLLSLDGQPPTLGGSTGGLAAIAVRVERNGEPLDVTLQPTMTTEGVPHMIGVAPLANRIAGIRPGSTLIAGLGLQRGDRILAVDDQPFLSGDLERVRSGPAVSTWLVLRDGQQITLSHAATVGERAELVDRLAVAGDLRLQFRAIDGGAAQAAGLLPGDWLQAIDGKDVKDWDQLRTIVLAAEGEPLHMRLLRPDSSVVTATLDKPSGTVVELTVTPRVTPETDLGWTLSVAPLMNEIQAESIGEAIKLGTVCSLDLIKQLYVTMKRLVTGEVGAKNLGGIIRISQISYQAAQRGPSWFLYFLALLSVNLAFVNLLPIPVLDGGHLMFLLIEKVKGSPVSTKVFGYSQVIGLVFVLLLVLFVTYNDILRLL